MGQWSMALLRQTLARRFSLEELRTAAFDLNFDAEGFDNRAALARELLLFLERRDQVDRVTTWLRDNRPDIDLTSLALETQSSSPPSPSPLAAPPNNLPALATPLVGRDQAVAALVDLLRARSTRLVTLLGPGGIGKTRLAQEVGTRLLDDFADGVFFVSLAAIREPTLVVPTIAHTLSLPELSGQPLLDSLKASLEGKQMLLLLDNFEQVVAAAPVVAELLAAAPSLKALVTSQSVIRVREEREFELGPLPVPDLKGLAEQGVEAVSQLSLSPAVSLFVQRAQARKAAFALTPANAATIAAICARLEGVPLAIELAAAWIKVLTPQAILQRLDRRLEFLNRGERDMPERQQTLRRTLDWSFDLLTTEEKGLVCQLAVFAGGFTLEASEAVCRPGPTGAGGPPLDVLDGVASLVEKSLVQMDETPEGELRYTMLALIREYAFERLAASAEAADLQRRHAAYFLALVEEAEGKLVGPDQAAWLDRLETEHNNLRAALRWASQAGETEVGLRYAGALWRFWFLRGYLSEGRDWVEGMLRIPDPTGGYPAYRAKALNSGGVLTTIVGDYGAARAYHEEALALRRRLGDKGGLAATLNNLGEVARCQTDYTAAVALYEESAALKRELGDKRGIAAALNNLGEVARAQTQYAVARARYEESLALCRTLGDQWAMALVLNNLGETALDQGEYASACTHLEESLAIKRELGDQPGIAFSLSLLGEVMRCQGDLPKAQALAQESLSLRRELGDKQGVSNSLLYLARIALDQSDYQGAYAQLRQSLALRRELGDKAGIAECLEGLALWLVLQPPVAPASPQGDSGDDAQVRRSEQAIALLAGANAIRENIGSPVPPAHQGSRDQALALARSYLNEAQLASALARGQALVSDLSLLDTLLAADDRALFTP